MDRVAEIDLTPGRRVALVHHNTLLREGLCRLLSDGDFDVVWHGGDAEGMLAAVRERPLDLLLVEWEAPGVDISLVERLAGLPGNVPVVVMSRPDTTDDLSSALTAGAAGCLSANLGASDFLAALEMLARGDILVSSEMVPAVTSGAPEGERPHDKLTGRELEILRVLARGATNQEIAAQMFISQHTVKIYVHRTLAKLDLRNRQQAAAYAAAEGLIDGSKKVE